MSGWSGHPGYDVEFTPDLIAALSALTASLDDPSLDLDQLVHDLARAAAESVESLTSFTLTVVVEDYPFSLTVATNAAVVASSAWIPLQTATGSVTSSGILLFSSVAGAFVDLAADVAYALSLDLDAIVIDDHLLESATAALDMMGALEERTVIDQALGVLMERGLLTDDARTELRAIAQRHDCTVVRAARSVIDGAITTRGDSAT